MELGLGTVQFGLDYGVSNRAGKPSLQEISEIFSRADELAYKIIDTAPSYGNSENVIGQCLPENHLFQIVTKTPHIGSSVITELDCDRVKSVFFKSLKSLIQQSLYGLLVHNVSDVLVEHGCSIMQILESFKKQGLVKKIGVSIYSCEQIEEVLKRYEIDLIQIPINLLDQRLVNSGILSVLKAKDIEIHARSIFLQGLLLMHENDLNPYFNSIKSSMLKYRKFLEHHELSPLAGALAFINNVREIDCGILGTCSVIELQEQYDALRRVKNLDINFSSFSCSDEKILNPSLWQLQ